MAPHVCKVHHCIHVFAGLGPVNARGHVTNTTDAEMIVGMVVTIAQDEHSSNQFPLNSSTSRKSEALSRSNSLPLLCAAIHCCACRIGPSPCMSFPYSHKHERSAFMRILLHRYTS